MNEMKTRGEERGAGGGCAGAGWMPTLKRLGLLPSLLLLSFGVARAQWLTQTLELKAGWNAVFLHVDPSHATIDELLVNDGAFAVQEVWMWRPELSSQQFVDSPQSPVSTDSRWTSWTRAKGPESALNRMFPNMAYLVKVDASVPTYSWALKGKPVAPSYTWSTSGLNFLGFPVADPAPPTFDAFLSKAPTELSQAVEFYRYVGGPLGPGNPGRVFGLRTATMARGQAYWVKAGDYFNRYFAPFELSVSGSGEIKFGEIQRTVGIRMNNLTASPLEIRLAFLASEATPAGQPAIAGPIPLLIRGTRNIETGSYAYTRLNAATPATWTLAPAGKEGSGIEVVLGVDRSQPGFNSGDLLAGILRFTDGGGQTRMDVAVSSVVGNTTGLWVGQAAVNQVGQYLKKYAIDAAGQTTVGEDGKYVAISTNTAMTGVAAAFPMRLIIHNPTSGPASLFQRIFTGYDSQTNVVVARSESVLDASKLADARRISAPHLPFTTTNTSWRFNGPVTAGATLSVSVTNRFDDGMSNPFVHTYHPDHDNLNARFTQTLPQGSESYTIVRDITLQITPPSDDFGGRTSVGETLGGVYSETLRVLGLARGGGNADTRSFEVRGEFQLNRLTPIGVVSAAP